MQRTAIVLEKWEAALLVFVFGGAIVTFVLAEIAYWRLRRSFPELSANDRSRIGSALLGILERFLLTMLTIWFDRAVGAIASAMLAIEALAWGEFKDRHPGPSRWRFGTSYLVGLIFHSLGHHVGNLGQALAETCVAAVGYPPVPRQNSQSTRSEPGRARFRLRAPLGCLRIARVLRG